jgi:DNA-binding response OmpR family regulator
MLSWRISRQPVNSVSSIRPQQLHRLHILLVDSDAHVREKVRQALGAGFTLSYACSLDEAQRFLAEALPDIVICEMVLPDSSGLELCRLVRRSLLWQHLPIMLLTSLSTLQDKVAGFEAGADDYLVKPFDARHLVARLRLLSRIKHLEFDRG